MADLATNIPAGKNVHLISLFGKEKDIQISTAEIYFLGHKTLREPKEGVRSPSR
jgi:hypothetical protein